MARTSRELIFPALGLLTPTSRELSWNKLLLPELGLSHTLAEEEPLQPLEEEKPLWLRGRGGMLRFSSG